MKSTGRMAILDHVFDEASFDIIGTQESRLGISQQLQTENYLIYSSACNSKGSLGVLLWVRKALAESLRLVVDAVSPRLLVATGWMQQDGEKRAHQHLRCPRPHQRCT